MDKRDYQLMQTSAFKDQKKLDDEMANHKIKCKNCGHTVVLTFYDKAI